MIAEFRAFLVKSNALALAIGVIIGVALGTVVTSLVEDIIMPPIGLLLGGGDVAERVIPLNADGSVAIRYGEFIMAVVTFVLVAFIVWRISKAFVPAEPEPERIDMRACPYCLDQIPTAARRCRACGSEL
ncbi:MAG: large conductance mechanosensitive channel protein MscL [Chloroflexi bacterium]|nr:large conductance mechanosensitive channel protein MscL [Chloroflexota bacterium]